LIKRFKTIVGAGAQPGATAPPTRGATFDRAALAALQRDEVKVANADLACEKRHITPVELEVRPQYEAAFRKQNRQLLDQVRPVAAQ
jgi:hypothetical protein